MNGEAAILSVVSRLYAAAAAPDGWADALQSLVEAMGAEHAILVAGGAEANGGFVAAAGVEPHMLQRVLSPESLQMAQPFNQGLRVGAVASISMLMTLREWERSGFYNEIIRPMNGYFGLLSGRLQFPSEPFTLSVCRRQSAPDFDANQIAMMQTLVPHVATAIELHLRLRASEQTSEQFACLLDRLDAGVILVDAAARPIFANARARSICSEDDGLLLRSDGLTGATQHASQQLQESITACAHTEVRSRQIWLDRRSLRPPLLLSLLPLSRMDATVPGTPAPRVAIFITETDAPAVVNRLALADVYRLTQRETEVATLLADGLSVDAIAASLNLGRGTVRSHMARLFDKTGAHSQSALVALVRGFAEVCR